MTGVPEQSPFQPYVSEQDNVAEFTWVALVLGVLQAVFFGVADAYLALKLGMTVGASIPAAVISMSILRGILRRGTVLENNLVQNMASVGESLAAGATFTIPALYLLQDALAKKGQPPPFELSLPQVYFITCMGGLMGIFFMIPMRRYLIVKEHGRLRYPEGTACAEVLMAGDKGGQSAGTVFAAIAVAGLYRIAMNALGLFKDIVTWPVLKLKTELSFDLLPSLMAVGFILGLETCGIMMAGAALGWFVIIPLISFFGQGLTTVVAPADGLISAMAPYDVWSFYLRYIGAGAVAFGGLVSLFKAMPTIIDSIAAVFRELKGSRTGGAAAGETGRTSKDIPLTLVLGAWLMIFLMIGLNRGVNQVGFLGAFLAVAFAFFFVTVSSRIVGIVGTTSMPLSGMTIGALLVTCLVIKNAGYTAALGMGAALVIASMVCIAISMGGDISQDLKIGFLLGATPMWVQITQVISVLISSASVCLLVQMMAPQVVDHTYKAPQANLLFLVTQGVIGGELPWVPVMIGMCVAACVEMMGIGSLPFAVGLYLPLELTTTLMFGGLIHYYFHQVYAKDRHKRLYDHGLLVCSGLVAGDALVGVMLAVLARAKVDWTVPGFALAQNQAFAVLCFSGLCVYLFWQVRKAAQEPQTGGGPTQTPDLGPVAK
ncbi:oligopeptide transporter, OPT family [bacterium]|nr:oligopeptide transporter, OPT family [bacterium]